MALTVVRRDGPAAVTLTPQGEVDPDTAPALEAALDAALDGGAPAPIVVDLSGVRFLDSAGISALLRGRRRTVAAGRAFRVTGADDFVAEVLHLTGVWDLLAGGAP
ncbi:STAS domain-containing protein [Dactylosporangium sp. CA-139066]|uniref:STAS domain-containing protein n=1 Tax=Dactylosporangium sp. CA-139066 TaxID=3239930 RepID=UPI003D9463DE